MLGTWKLNVRKSTSSGAEFRCETRIYERQADGVKVTIRTVDGNGKLVTNIFLTTPDGKQHPVHGVDGPADSIALTQLDAFTAETTLTHAGKKIVRTTGVMSPDPNSMTITYIGRDPEGSPVNYRMVFEKIK